MDSARERLKQLYRLDLKIKRYERQIEDIKQRMYSVGSPSLENDRVLSSGSSDDRTLKLIARTQKLTKKIMASKEQAVRLYAQISDEIERVPEERYRTILTDRYILYMEFEAIADEMGYVVGHIYRLHQEAVKEYARVTGYGYW